MLNLFQLREIEENKTIRFNLLMLIIGIVFVGSVVIYYGTETSGFFGNRYVGSFMIILGITIGLAPSYKIYREEEK